MKTVIAALLIVSLSFFCGAARAEISMDVYAGQASTSSTRVSALYDTWLGAPESDSRLVNFSTSSEIGFKLIYWNDDLPSIGVGFDIADYQAYSPDVQVDMITCSFLFMLRGTIGANERFRSGWLQPYIGIGLITYYADVDVDFTPVMSMAFSGSDFGDSIGFDLRTGLRVLLTPNLALYGELKYSSIGVEINSSEFDIFEAWQVKGLDMETTHIGGGLSLIF